MTIKKRRHYSPPPTKTTLLDCLDEKSLNVLRSLGCNIEDLRARGKAKDKLPQVVDKIRKNYKALDEKSRQELKTMCYVCEIPDKAQVIIRPFAKKLIELNDYVNNNPAFRQSH